MNALVLYLPFLFLVNQWKSPLFWGVSQFTLDAVEKMKQKFLLRTFQNQQRKCDNEFSYGLVPDSSRASKVVIYENKAVTCCISSSEMQIF